MKKKATIILSSVVAICGLGLIASHFIDWPINFNDASGDIAKSDRFSRKEAVEKITNMEELIKNDSEYKDGIVAAQVVMQTRAIQFASLVGMSNEVAGKLPEFEDLLKDMNETLEMVNNVNASLVEAGNDLNAVLDGGECPDLTQHTINAALAYTTLQKQNKLANRFIDTTDKYLKNAKGDDRLKFVRDQWLEYQQVTAALEGNKESADALAKKGNLLSAEKTLSAMGNFNLADQISVLVSSNLAAGVGAASQLANSIPNETFEKVLNLVKDASGSTLQMGPRDGGLMQSQQSAEKIFSQSVSKSLNSLANDASGALKNNASEQLLKGLANASSAAMQNAAGASLINMQTAQMVSLTNVMSAFDNLANTTGAASLANSNSASLAFGAAIGNVIGNTAQGNIETLNQRKQPKLIPDL
jgi:hypothetical protein